MSRSFPPPHIWTTPGWLHILTSFYFAYRDVKLCKYYPQENSFTCDLAPGVIGTLKLFKSQMKISESFAPEAKRLLYRKKKSSAEFHRERGQMFFKKTKCKQKTQKVSEVRWQMHFSAFGKHKDTNWIITSTFLTFLPSAGSWYRPV